MCFVTLAQKCHYHKEKDTLPPVAKEETAGTGHLLWDRKVKWHSGTGLKNITLL